MTPLELAALMTEHDINQYDLADIVGTSQPAINQMVHGKRNITKKMATRIEEAIAWYVKEPTKRERAKYLKKMQAAVDAVMEEG